MALRAPVPDLPLQSDPDLRPIRRLLAGLPEMLGLTYESRQHGNYKDTGRFSAFGLTHRSMAESQTWHARERGAAAAAERYAERANVLRQKRSEPLL